MTIMGLSQLMVILVCFKSSFCKRVRIILNPIQPEGGAYMTRSSIIAWYPKKITIKDVFEIIWLFLKWFQRHFKKDLRSIGCIDKFLWWFQIAWSQYLLSRFSEDSGEMRIWLSDDFITKNVSYFICFLFLISTADP